MADRPSTTYRPSPEDDDALPIDLDADDFDAASDDDDDELEALIGGGARRFPGPDGGCGARGLPHDWADFDYGGGDDWR